MTLPRSLEPYLLPGVCLTYENDIPMVEMPHKSEGMIANAYYFSHPEWTTDYLQFCHRSPELQARWQAAIGSWDNQIVVDLCCGPGNLAAVLSDTVGQPRLLIGIDIALGSLKSAIDFGYQPLYADAHHIPLIDGFADTVVINAGLHHCDDMAQVLQEAARLVKPGGRLIIDHDPQKTAWKDSHLAKLIWQARLPIYRLLQRGGHRTKAEQDCGQRTELHHHPGDGVTPTWFEQHLIPLGFTVRTYPHNNTGAETFQGQYGQPEWKSRIAQWLTGIHSNTPEAALLLMCIAQREL
jgi:ubiquinone/menaquinone biosynthesis C-methylase UbiE